MKITEYEKIKLQIKMMDLGLLDSFILEYYNTNYSKFKTEFWDKLYKWTNKEKSNYTRKGWTPDIEFIRFWWLKNKYPELFDKELLSKW